MVQKRLIKINKNKNLKKILLHFLMKKGNKNISEQIILSFLKTLQKTSKKPPKNIIKLGICNTIMILSVKLHKNKLSRKKQIKYIPYFLKNLNRILLTIKILIKTSQDKLKDPIFIKIKNEFLSAAKNNGLLTTKRHEIYSLVYEKKKFAHYRWFF